MCGLLLPGKILFRSSLVGPRVLSAVSSVPDPMDATQARKDEIQKELDRVTREIRNTRRRHSRQIAVPPSLWRVATTIFAMTHPDVEPAATFLEQRWQRWHEERRRVEPLLRGWYAQLLLTSTVAAVLVPSTRVGRTAVMQARTFLQELDLHQWVDVANKTQGIAPMSSIMLERAAQSGASTNQSPLLRESSLRKSNLQWLRRWRRRWGVGLGALRPRDTLPPAECVRKAAKLKPFSYQKPNRGLPKPRSLAPPVPKMGSV